MVIMGGGVVGVEMSQAFQTLGAQVTLIEGERRLIPNEEEFACVAAHRGAARRSASTSARGAEGRARSSRRRTATVTVHHRRRRHAPSADVLLVALGRTPPTQRPRPRGRSASSPARRSRSTRTCASPATTGSTRSATSTAARCSRTWASTRRALAADHLLGHDHALAARRRRPALAARDLHRAAGRGRRPHDRDRRGGGPRSSRSSRRRPRATPAARSTAATRPGTTQLDRRPRARRRRRLHDHRRRDRRLPARGDDRDRRRGAARPPAPRDPALPDAQRDLAASCSRRPRPGVKRGDAEGAARGPSSGPAQAPVSLGRRAFHLMASLFASLTSASGHTFSRGAPVRKRPGANDPPIWEERLAGHEKRRLRAPRKGRGGSRSRSPPPAAEASGLRAAGLSPRWPRSLRL